MSLSAREQETLHRIADELADSDPRLASWLAMFARLTSDDEMPEWERIGALRRGNAHNARHGRSQPRRNKVRRLYQRGLGWSWTVLLIWFVVSIALIATALILGNVGGRSTCTRPRTAACAKLILVTSEFPPLAKRGDWAAPASFRSQRNS